MVRRKTEKGVSWIKHVFFNVTRGTALNSVQYGLCTCDGKRTVAFSSCEAQVATLKPGSYFQTKLLRLDIQNCRSWSRLVWEFGKAGWWRMPFVPLDGWRAATIFFFVCAGTEDHGGKQPQWQAAAGDCGQDDSLQWQGWRRKDFLRWILRREWDH